MSGFLVAAGFQAVVILVDEFFYHHKRGLPRWERLGHPMDTATVLACLLFIGLAPKTPMNEIIYYALAIFSCVFITKDEWVHRKYCSGAEMWLHALLFVVHPLLLFGAYSEWETNQNYFLLAAAGIVVFFVYQVVYWNFIEYKLQERRKAAPEELPEYFGE